MSSNAKSVVGVVCIYTGCGQALRPQHFSKSEPLGDAPRSSDRGVEPREACLSRALARGLTPPVLSAEIIDIMALHLQTDAKQTLIAKLVGTNQATVSIYTKWISEALP